MSSSNLSADQRNILRRLVQYVARTFFETEQIVALDQLAKHDVCVALTHVLLPSQSRSTTSPPSTNSPGYCLPYGLNSLSKSWPLVTRRALASNASQSRHASRLLRLARAGPPGPFPTLLLMNYFSAHAPQNLLATRTSTPTA